MGIEDYEKQKRTEQLPPFADGAVTYNPRDVAQKLAANRANAVREAEGLLHEAQEERFRAQAKMEYAERVLDEAENERHKAQKLKTATRDMLVIMACLLGVTVAAWVFTLQNLAAAQRACIATLQANKD